jgi:hypothetical protein
VVALEHEVGRIVVKVPLITRTKLSLSNLGDLLIGDVEDVH